MLDIFAAKSIKLLINSGSWPTRVVARPWSSFTENERGLLDSLIVVPIDKFLGEFLIEYCVTTLFKGGNWEGLLIIFVIRSLIQIGKVCVPLEIISSAGPFSK